MGKCVRYVCDWLGVAWVERGVSGLGLSFTNPVITGRVLDVCYGSVGVEWVGDLDQGLDGWCCLCEMWVWILCVDGRSRYLCIVLGGYLRI